MSSGQPMHLQHYTTGFSKKKVPRMLYIIYMLIHEHCSSEMKQY